MKEVTATIFRDGKVIDRVALDASMPQEGESAFIWIVVAVMLSICVGLYIRFKKLRWL